MAESGDLQGLTQGVEILIKDEARAIHMGKASLAFAKGHANVHTIEAHERLYRQLMEEEPVIQSRLQEAGHPLGENA